MKNETEECVYLVFYNVFVLFPESVNIFLVSSMSSSILPGSARFPCVHPQLRAAYCAANRFYFGLADPRRVQGLLSHFQHILPHFRKIQGVLLHLLQEVDLVNRSPSSGRVGHLLDKKNGGEIITCYIGSLIFFIHCPVISSSHPPLQNRSEVC